MPILVIAFMILTMLAVAATVAYMVLTALDPKHVPPRLHKLQRRLQDHMAPEWVYNQRQDEAGPMLQEDGLAIFDELLVAEYEFELPADLASALRTTGMPTLTSESALPESEVLLFLRAELAVQLGMDLDIRGSIVNMSRKQYAKLKEYVAFAFDTIETPESYLGQYGITEIHFVPRRGGFGYHSIGKH